MDIIKIKPSSPYENSIKEWLWMEWGKENNRQFTDRLISSTLGEDLVPSTWGYIQNEILVGTVSLFVIDLKCRQDLTPWVACLYVHPDYRKRGIGTKLLKHAEDVALDAGYDSVYLFTHLEVYYENAGWIFMGMEMNSEGYEVRLYKKELAFR